MNLQALLQILGQLLLGSGRSSKNWQEYGGVTTRADTLISRARLRIISFASQLPLGQLWGPYAADLFVGSDFSHGILHNGLSGLMAPLSSTFAGTYQNLYNKQITSSLQRNREQTKEDLRRAFLTNYFKLTTDPTNDDAKIADLVKNAGDLSLPSALNFLLDPASNERILSNIESAQSSVLSWNLRQDPKLHFGIEPLPEGWASARQMAEGMGNTIKQMAIDANNYALGLGNNILQNHFGGFSGALVSLLASIISNASLQLNPADLSASLKNFLLKVRMTARALSPLKDIFGRDVKAMVDMLQDVTGQNISQLTPTMIQSISSSTVDLSRYSGATVAQMAQAGKALMAMSVNMGGTTFSRIGTGQLGGFYSSLMAVGNTPAGVHAALYAASTKQALASAQASLGVDWAAMAYGVWVQKQREAGVEEKNINLDAFMQKVSEARGNSHDMMLAIVKASGASSQQLLLAGRGTTEYRVALQDPRLARLGLLEQYREHLQDTVYGLAQNDPKAYAEYDDFLAYMSDSNNAMSIHQLVTHSNDPAAVLAFVARASEAGKNFSILTVNKFLNSKGSLLYTARWSSQENIRQYQEAQAAIRRLLASLLPYNGGGNFTLFNALTQASNIVYDSDKVVLENLNGAGKPTTLSRKAFLFMVGGLLGTTNKDELLKGISNLKLNFGAQRAANMLTNASNKVASDPAYVLSIRTLARLGKYLNLLGEDKKNWLSAFLKVISTLLGIDVLNFTTSLAKNFEKAAFRKYYAATSKNLKGEEPSQKKKLAALKLLKTRLQYASRILRAQQMTADNFLGDSLTEREGKLKAFKAIMRTYNSLLSESLFNNIKEKGGLSYKEYQQAYKEAGSGYDLKTDALRIMKTVAELLLRWLRRHP